MADVFLSYKRSERSQVERIASTLRELGLTVWFDASMSAGDTFNDEIDREARTARAVLVCWSPAARDSEWVKAEAMIGFTQKKLAACYVAGPDGFDPPTPFNTRHAEDLRGWFATPSEVHSSWKSVLRTIGKLCGRADIESYGALDTQATAADLRTWIDAHEQSPLFVTVDNLLRQRDNEEAERGRIEQAARERRMREEGERRAREAAERAAREQEERRRPRPAAVAETAREVDTSKAQPSGFLTLFLTEMFERFAYYGARVILIFYIVEHLAFADQDAYGLYGVFTGLLFLLPLLVAIIADRLIGARRSVTTGSLLLLAGYAGLAISASTGLGEQAAPYAFAALALIVVGSGFVKPSLWTTLGSLYAENDPRRDGGFTALYVGVNAGALVAALACGYLGQRYGWAYGFGLAAAGMLLGLVIYLAGQNTLKRSLIEAPVSVGGHAISWAFAVAAVLGVFVMLMNAGVAEQFVPMASVAGFATVFLYALASFSGEERSRLVLAFALIAVVTVFWTLFELSGASLSVFADRNVDLSGVPGLTAQHVQSLPTVMVVLSGLPLAFLWVALARGGMAPSVGMTFAFGMLLVAAGFLVATFAAQFADQDARVPLTWLMLLFFLQSLGELFVVPIGMSAMTKLAPLRVTSVMIGMWHMGPALAQPVAAQLTVWLSPETVAGQVLDPADALSTNVDVFMKVGLVGLGAGIALMVLWPLLSRLSRGVR